MVFLCPSTLNGLHAPHPARLSRLRLPSAVLPRWYPAPPRCCLGRSLYSPLAGMSTIGRIWKTVLSFGMGFKSSMCTHINLSTITSRSRGQFHVSSNKTEYTPFTPLHASCSENRVLHAVKTARRTWSCSPPSHSSTVITSGVVLLNTSAFVLQQSTIEPCLHLKYL